MSDGMCILILDENLNLIAGSHTADHHDALIFRNNRLIGLAGVSEPTFCKSLMKGISGTKTILLSPAENEMSANRLILRVTPLSYAPAKSAAAGLAWVCVEVTTLDAYYADAVKRVTDKFNLTKAETIVLKYLMMGLSSEEIKEKMMIGTPTLRTHQQRLRQKTGESTSTRAILAALNPENRIDEMVILGEPGSMPSKINNRFSTEALES